MRSRQSPNQQRFSKDLFSVTAHELKTPITTLKLLNQIYIKKNKSGISSVKLEELQAIDRELNRLTILIDDLLDASTVAEGKLNLRMQTVDLTGLIVKTVKQMRNITQDHLLSFDDSISAKIEVYSDSNRLTQVLLNLLTNAIKYSPKDSTVKISTKKYKNRVVVAVKNFGEGLSKTKQTRVFGRFYQAEDEPKNGKGLGLYITKEILKQLDGEIWLKSQMGRGCTFAFSLPYKTSTGGI